MESDGNVQGRMNNTEIYTVLLSREFPFEGRPYPFFGFSYQIFKDARDGSVFIREHTPTPTRIVLWEQDGPELADLTEEQVKERIEEVLSA